MSDLLLQRWRPPCVGDPCAIMSVGREYIIEDGLAFDVLSRAHYPYIEIKNLVSS
jgi:hypothetical protein